MPNQTIKFSPKIPKYREKLASQVVLLKNRLKGCLTAIKVYYVKKNNTCRKNFSENVCKT